MNLNKMSPLLQLALIFPTYISVEAFYQITSQNILQEEWKLIVQYHRDLEELSNRVPFSYETINGHFAFITINKDLIADLSNERSVFYIELPRVMQYIAVENALTICAPQAIYTPQSYNVSGEGVIVAIMDSGIDYSHFDFRNEDGTTRVLAIWDQNLEGTPPPGFSSGAYFTKEQIDEALSQPTQEERLTVVPSTDILGHGTAVTGVVAGNGRASGGQNQGVAPKSDILVVKMSEQFYPDGTLIGPTNADVMRGITFAISQASMFNKPVSLMIGTGLNEGAHAGYSNLEIFIDQMSIVWPINMSVGTGNEANKERHTSGTVVVGEVRDIQISIEPGEKFYIANLYKNFVDDMSFVIIAPNGEKTDILQDNINNVAYVFGNTSVLINISSAPFSARSQELIILLEGFGTEFVDPGIWRIQIIGNAIVDGRYNVWATVTDQYRRGSRFLEPDPFTTLTIPSTAHLITSIASINGRTSQILTTSGRGYTVDDRVKPDVSAPGLNVTVPQAGTEALYTTMSGSSIATAFMCGAYALFIQYGLRIRPDSYLYGEALKGLVMRYARKPSQFGTFPNQAYGYGILCISDVLDELERIYGQQ